MSVEPSVNGEVRHAPVPVATPVRALARRPAGLLGLPMPRGTAVAAAGGIAGAAVFSTIRLLRRRRRARAGRRGRRMERSVVGTRSFLVDVHFLGK